MRPSVLVIGAVQPADLMAHWLVMCFARMRGMYCIYGLSAWVCKNAVIFFSWIRGRRHVCQCSTVLITCAKGGHG
jgi:hypothetical protein